MPFHWGPEAEGVFVKIKRLFSAAPILVHPDTTRQFILETDASNTGVGAVLSQVSASDNWLHPCAFFSKKLSPAERNYDLGNRELLAVKLALEEWRHWLEGSEKPFIIWTDHQNLVYLQKTKRLNSRQARWALLSGRFNFTLTDRPGSKNVKPDALSRQFDTCPEREVPENILPGSCTVASVTWKIEAVIQRALQEEPDPRRFINACTTCARNKASHQALAGLLQPLPVPSRPWSHIGVDFVTGLPPSEGNTTILTVVDRFRVIAQVQLEPKNASVICGTDVRFNCSLSQPNWVAMTWSLNDNVVLTISEKFGVLKNSERFNATDYTTDQSYKWEFVLYNVQLNDSGEVTCDLQNIDRKTATLSVQESGTVNITSGNVTAMKNQPATIHCLAQNWFPAPLLTWKLDRISVNQDNYNISTEASAGLFNSASTVILLANDSAPVECQATVPALAVPQTSNIFLTIIAESSDQDHTVLIPVTVSVLSAALLVLLIIGIIFCCKRRMAKSSYEEEVRKTRSLSERNTSEIEQGKDNIAYLPDDSQQGVTPGEFNYSGFDQTNAFHTLEMPDVLYNSNHTANGHDPIPVHGIPGSKKHRHATIV
ncbi:uncharacterized protein LOC133133290 [Conger conger]|uniref:uncharacterized protein LOC133133290 n=1 Tax=Conger conger TaxID=82655 RepID=UPI002A5AD7E0|nr:uncharacterized protein LOC133133290 [Conger conger]